MPIHPSVARKVGAGSKDPCCDVAAAWADMDDPRDKVEEYGDRAAEAADCADRVLPPKPTS